MDICLFSSLFILSVQAVPRMRIPDEQTLYEDLMLGYERSVRPVINSSTVLIVTFGLKLNQIIDLDERHQVLTTNVFIDQAWRDENLLWEPSNYSQIRSIRIPAKRVWLPDTFIYNNADDGSTGFMQGTYVLLNSDGTVVWPVPVKLKSSCSVDITYFPFDDQECVLRFGSWIYSGLLIDYKTMHNDTPIDLTAYVNNSEWDLLSVKLKKNIRTHACCSDPHPDLTYVLHIRRKTFYYIFNIIVPCVMLSSLTLLTFWLPPTSGEKITLGLSVFLAFSMFMLLIAEEVPATSESVPLIGVYLCVVMTMTSLSVIMAVIVINLYNRGLKTKRAPYWLRKLTLVWFSKVMFLRHDIKRLAKDVVLEDERGNSFKSKKHPYKSARKKSSFKYEEMGSFYSENNSVRNRRFSNKQEMTSAENIEDDSEEIISLKEFEKDELAESTCEEEVINLDNAKDNNNSTKVKRDTEYSDKPKFQSNTEYRKYALLYNKKIIVAEWQRIAAVIDRILFWFYFLGTVASYIIILVVVPNSNYSKWDKEILHTDSAVR